MKVYYPATPASDGTSMTPPSNAQFTVHELTDTTFSNPLPLESLAGTNAAPFTTTAQGVLPDVYVISDNYSHVFRSGQWQFRRDSFDGAQKATEAAKQDASTARASAVQAASAASSAGKDAAAAATTLLTAAKTAAVNAASSATNSLAQATAARKAAEAAAAAAANASGGVAIAGDSSNPGLYYVVPGGQISPDPANPGLYRVGA